MFIAISGERALQIVEQISPDLILLDVMMPGINGFETCEKIKKIKTVGSVPIIFMSALTQIIDKVRAFEVGGIDYLTKPINKDELIVRVQTHVKLHLLQKEVTQSNKELKAYNQVFTATQRALDQSTMVSVVDLQGKMIKVNDEVCRVTQFSRDELLGQSHAVLNSGYHKKSFWGEMWDVILQGKTWRGEIRNKRKDGSFFWVDSVISPYTNEKGKPTSFLVVRFLITTRKELEKELIEKNQLFTQSIDYAKNIQNAVLPTVGMFKEFFPESFIIYRPKDIVSGDFYWVYKDFVNDRTYLAIVDCTGHGVPGGFMTMLGQSMLSNIILYHHIYNPDEILDEMNDNVIRMLHQDDQDVHVHDGMDMAMLVIDHSSKKITYSGAKRPLVYLKDGEIKMIKASKFSIGSFLEGTEKVFEKHEIDYTDEMSIFLYSDGVTDQFNQEQEYKFSRRRLLDFLEKNQNSSLKKQGELLIETLQQWEGNAPQIDDILIVGFKCQF